MKSIFFALLSIFIAYGASGQSAQQKGDSTSQAPYENKDDNSYRKLDDLVAVSPDHVPQELKTTLKQPQYRGWEQAKLFRSGDGKTYELQMAKGKKTKIYRFDSRGQVVTD